MQETRNNCFGSKKYNTTLRQAITGKRVRRNVTCFVRCYYISALVLTCVRLKKGRAAFFDSKQLLRVSCILWCYLSKWYSTILLSGHLNLQNFLQFVHTHDSGTDISILNPTLETKMYRVVRLSRFKIKTADVTFHYSFLEIVQKFIYGVFIIVTVL